MVRARFQTDLEGAGSALLLRLWPSSQSAISMNFLAYSIVQMFYQLMSRFYGLDMLRGIAALMVALNHAAYLGGGWTPFGRSYLAVDFFFLLSGFVIAAAFEDRMSDLGARSFFNIRISRLWPLIALGVFVSYVSKLLSGYDPYVVIIPTVLAMFFLPTLDGGFYLNNPMWSIHFEIFANIVHFFLLRRLPTSTLTGVVGFCAILLIMTSGIYDADFGQGDRYLSGFPRVMLSYTLGVVIWRLNGGMPRGTALISFTLLPVAIILASYVGWADYIVILLVNPVILLCGLQLKEAGIISTLARFMGAWSFPLYALHWPFQEILLRSGHDWTTAAAWSIFATLIFGMAADKRLRRAVPLDLRLTKDRA